MTDIKYHPLVDRDSEGTDKVAMFFSGNEETVRNAHDFYLEEIVPKHFRLCSVKGAARKTVDSFTLHCPYCGKALSCFTKSEDKYHPGMYRCPDCIKSDER